MNQETQHLQHFIEIYPDIPSGKKEFKDSPDLRILAENEIIGIEHTQIINEKEVGGKAHEVLEERIVRKAQDIFEQENLTPLYVYTHFSKGTKLFKDKVNKIAYSLAMLVLDNLPEKGQHKFIECWQLPYEFPPEISSVHIWWFEKETTPLWAVPRAGMVPDLTSNLIQNIIQRKETLLQKYRKSCDKVWLLIVADGFTPVGHWIVTDDTLNTEYITNFGRVILFENFSGKFRDLKAISAPNSA
jgi:hypothetical protein